MESLESIVSRLRLEPHPEGGYFRETYRHHQADGSRGAGTAIYFLLPVGRPSRWHRVDADEIWHWYAGAPLALDLSADGRGVERRLLGPDLAAGQEPQRLIARRVWQAAESLGTAGEWTLVGCTVSPAFLFEGFEMAPDGWAPSPD